MEEQKPKVDAVTLALIDGRLIAISHEIARVLVQTSRSPLFASGYDFDTATLDKYRRLLSQADYSPVMTCCIPPVVDNIAKEYEGDIYEGDVFIHNDPFTGNNHPPDVNVVKPVFYQGELTFWTACKGHVLDIGSYRGVASFNPQARTMWEDGLIIPAVKLYERGKLNTSLWKLILNQIRLRDITEADLMCEVGAVTTGEKALLALLDQYGKEVLYAVIDEIMIGSEREMRGRISLIPDGVYYGEDYSDWDGQDKSNLVAVRAKVIKKGSDITVDFSDSDPQNDGYMNSSYANTLSAVATAIFSSLPGQGEVRRTAGSYAPIKLVTRKGTCVDAEFPHSVNADTLAMTETIIPAVWKALAKAIPEWVSAPWSRYFHPCMQGFNPRTRRNFADVGLIDFGGSGATDGFDGWDHTVGAVAMGQEHAEDIEIVELVFPVRVHQNELKPDRAAVGKYRGSHANITRLEVLTDGIEAVIVGSGCRRESTAASLFDAKHPTPGQAQIIRAGGQVEEWDVHEFKHLNKGDTWEIISTTGGAMGEPFERPIEKVLMDVLDELLSVEKAREDYGVVIDPVTFEVDAKATDELRSH